MNTTQFNELNDWLDAEIKKYSELIKEQSDIYDAACLVSFQRMKEKINELTNIQYADIYKLIPLKREIADRFISNCLNEKIFGSFESNDEIILSIKKNGFKSTLHGAFDWKLSPEKGKFWFIIHNNLKK